MKATIRRKLEMARVALEFCLANPTTDRGHQAVISRLSERVARGDLLAQQQNDGVVGQHASAARRQSLRRKIRAQLRHVARVASTAAKTGTDLPGRFVLPDFHAPMLDFMSAARGTLAAVAPQRELFESLGLGDSWLVDLSQAIEQFDVASQALHLAMRIHVGARADLNVVAADCIALVAVLDGLNRARFHNDPERLAAWLSASNVAEPYRPRHAAAAEAEPGAAPPAPPEAPAPKGFLASFRRGA